MLKCYETRASSDTGTLKIWSVVIITKQLISFAILNRETAILTKGDKGVDSEGLSLSRILEMLKLGNAGTT